MATSFEQTLLYFVDLRLQVRRSSEACAIVDRCLTLLARARHADAETMASPEAEVETLRRDLIRRFGAARPLNAH